MTGLRELLSSELTYRLGWTLLHSLWQGAAVAVVFGLLLLLIPRAKANARYMAGCASMLAIVLICAITFAKIQPPPRRVQIPPAVAAPAAGVSLANPKTFNTLDTDPVPAKRTIPDAPVKQAVVHAPSNVKTAGPTPIPAPPWRDRIRDLARSKLTPFLPALAGLWLLGVCLLSFWRFGGLIATYRLRRIGTSPVSQETLANVARLSQRMRVSRPVRVLQSAIIGTPAVIGHLRPVILLPISAITGLSSDELEAILAHELAHIGRWDYLVNIAQTAIETLLFHHPAVWWISHRVRAERENCCDDLAVAACGNPATFARALTKVQESSADSLRLAVAASGGSLLERIRRIAGVSNECHTVTSRWPAGTVGLFIVFAALAGIRMSATAGPTNGPVPASQPDRRVGSAHQNDGEKPGGQSPPYKTSQPAGTTGESAASRPSQPDMPEIKGIVRFPDGSLAGGIQVIVSTSRSRARVTNGRLDPESKATTVTTDAQGRFALQRSKDLYEIIVLHDKGFAEVSADDLATSPELQLTTWGRVELTVLIGDKPAGMRDVQMFLEGTSDRKLRSLGYGYRGKTDEQGRYTWDRVVPGSMEVSYALGKSIRTTISDRPLGMYTHYTGAAVESGKTTKVTIGGEGRPVVGRIELPAKLKDMDLADSYGWVWPKVVVPYPPELRGKGPEAYEQWQREWALSPAGMAQRRSGQRDQFPINPDGSFRIDNVRPGQYEFIINVYQQNDAPRPRGRRVDEKGPVAWLKRDIEIPPGGLHDQLNLGIIPVHLVHFVGDTVPETVDTFDGKKLRLTDYRGKYLFLHFWAGGDSSSLDMIEELRAIKKADTAGQIAILGLNLDRTPDEGQAAIKNQNLPWQNVYLGNWDEVSLPRDLHTSTTGTLLIDPNGKIVSDRLTIRGIRQAVKNIAHITLPSASWPAAGGDDRAKRAEDRKRALQALQQIYTLKDGEDLRCVIAPFSEARREYLRSRYPTLREDDRAVLMTFRCLNGEPPKPGVMTCCSGAELRHAISMVTGFPTSRIQLNGSFPDERIIADFVIREGVAPERLVPLLELCLRSQLHAPVKLSVRSMDRTVVVVRGRYQFKPVSPDRGEIEIYDRSISNRDSGAGGGTGGWEKFLDHVGNMIGLPIWSEVGKPPASVSWRNNEPRPALLPNGERADKRAPDLILQHLSEQTGLTFTQETRQVSTLIVEASSADNTTQPAAKPAPTDTQPVTQQ